MTAQLTSGLCSNHQALSARTSRISYDSAVMTALLLLL